MRFPALLLLLVSTCLPWLGASQASTSAAGAAALLTQLEAAVPPCGVQCIVAGVSNSNCSITDTTCVCTNTALAAVIQGCVAKNCTVIEQLQTAKYQYNSCSAPIRDTGKQFQAVIWSLYSIAAFFAICRLVSRLPANFSWDDYTIIVALAGLTSVSVVAQKLVDFGLGQDIWQLTPDQITNTLKFFLVAEFNYSFVIGVTKLSILFLYLRIFSKQSFTIQCYILMVITVLHALGGIVSNFFYCKPLSMVWEGWDGQHVGTCPVDTRTQTYTLGSINIALDLSIFLLPIPQLLSLQMSWQRKIGVSLMFLVGLFETLCSVIRMWTITLWGNSTDPTYDYLSLAMWSIVELDVGIICSCMPGMALLLRRIWPKIFATLISHKSNSDWPQSGKPSTIGSAGKPRIHMTTDVSVSFGTTRGSGDDEFELMGKQESIGDHESDSSLKLPRQQTH